MARADAVLAAAQYIHEAPLAPDGWTRALPSIATATGSQQSIFLALDVVSGTVAFDAGFGMAPRHRAAWTAAARARALPAWMQTLAPGIVKQSSAMQPDRDLARSALRNEAGWPTGAFYALVVSPLRTRQCDVYLIVSRGPSCEDYDSQDVAVLQTLVPHIVTALRVSERLGWADQRAASASATLDRLHTGVILVDAAARVLFANQTAKAILAGNGGLGIDRESVCICSYHASRALRRLIGNCADITMVSGGPGGSMEIPRGEGRAPLQVIVAPFRADRAHIDTASWLDAARPVAILTVTDPEREQRERREYLRRRFGLTPAEADVALEILKGDGRAACAARLGIAATTVRAHLSHIFEKTGARRQAELVRVLVT